MKLSRRQFAALSLAGAGLMAAPAYLRATSAFAQPGGAAKNVILLISDGAGFHTWTAASYYQHGRLGGQVYDAFPVRTLMTTYPLNTATAPTGGDKREVSYEAAKAWSLAPMEGGFEGGITKKFYPHAFGGYDFVRQNYVDSAAAGTALSAGIKTYNNAINWTNGDAPARMMGDRVKAAGKALGVISSVQISHATPASFMCHNVSRNNYVDLGREIVETGLADVAMGAGHPLFDRDGRYVTPTDEGAFRFIGGPDIFTKLATGQTGYHFLDRKADFEALAEGRLELTKDKVLGLAPVATTLQYQRQGTDTMGSFTATVPSLETMTKGALNVLKARGENGFFLMVEGGAVDWACHGNHLGRMIEEQIDFNRSVEAAVAWVEANSSFEETLIIVTTDHGNGMIYGPESDRFAFQPVVNRGAGNLPDVQWHYDTHTNEVVPVWAKGPGAELLRDASTQDDAHTALVGWGEVSRVHDNTDVAHIIARAMNLPA